MKEYLRRCVRCRSITCTSEQHPQASSETYFWNKAWENVKFFSIKCVFCRGCQYEYVVTEGRKKQVSGSNAHANQGWLSKHGQTSWFWGRENTEERKKCNKGLSSLDTTGENKQKLKEGWGGFMESREGGLCLLGEAQSKVWGWEERQWWMWQEELRG